MIEKKIKIINKLGLHARAAAKIVTVSSKFSSSIMLFNGSKNADAKSIMKILMLAAPTGTELKISANGNDEMKAINALCKLIKNKFDEE